MELYHNQADPARSDLTDGDLIDLVLDVTTAPSDVLAVSITVLGRQAIRHGRYSRPFRLAAMALADRVRDGRLAETGINLEEPEGEVAA